MLIGPPKALDCPNPISSIRTIRILGAPAGALTSNLGGGVAFLTLKILLWGYFGSAIGSVVRSSLSVFLEEDRFSCAQTGATPTPPIKTPKSDAHVLNHNPFSCVKSFILILLCYPCFENKTIQPLYFW